MKRCSLFIPPTQETATTSSLLQLQAAGLVSIDSKARYAEFTTTKPFDTAAVVVGGVANVLTTVKVYRAYVSLQ